MSPAAKQRGRAVLGDGVIVVGDQLASEDLVQRRIGRGRKPDHALHPIQAFVVVRGTCSRDHEAEKGAHHKKSAGELEDTSITRDCSHVYSSLLTEGCLLCVQGKYGRNRRKRLVPLF
jgi:hypothetical protein